MDMQTLFANTWSHAGWLLRLGMIGLGVSAGVAAGHGLTIAATALVKMAEDLIGAGRFSAGVARRGLMALPLGGLNLMARASLVTIGAFVLIVACLGAAGY